MGSLLNTILNRDGLSTIEIRRWDVRAILDHLPQKLVLGLLRGQLHHQLEEGSVVLGVVGPDSQPGDASHELEGLQESLLNVLARVDARDLSARLNSLHLALGEVLHEGFVKVHGVRSWDTILNAEKHSTIQIEVQVPSIHSGKMQ